jgi:hypothetical protein
MDRTNRGWDLYNQGNVSLDFYDEEFFFFDVKSGNTVYMVEMERSEGVWRCICKDYHGRHLKAPGSFTCKHIQASMFKLAELIFTKEVIL